MMFDWKKFADQQQQSKPPSKQELELRLIEMLRTIYDPELPVNIYDLGLVYKLETEASGRVNVTMT
ncbi:MAG: FeS assembly SUF system protein, partial [Methylotenera sp.]